jgi:glyoxylase-like metal-dependent hydrolase (beta-lactamase superfamily II)
VDGDGQVTLVDCGVKRAPARIVAGLAAMGKAPSDVTRIILTHAHADHAGGAAEMSRRTGRPVDVHAEEAPFARSGHRALVDPSLTAGRLLNRAGTKAFDPVEVGEELTDGQLLPVAGGLRVVHTPGHTPGHVSLLHEPDGLLVTGDSIFNVRRLRWPVKALCSDIRLTQRTADRLGELDYVVAAFTHGPHLERNAREQVRTFLRAAPRV